MTTNSITPARGRNMIVSRLLRGRVTRASLLCITVLLALSLLAPWALPHDPVAISLSEKLQPPSLAHPFGTDYFGRDVLTRMAYGARISLTVGLSVILFAGLFGVPIGLASGYVGGRLDNLCMRVMDGLLAFPPLLLAVAVVGLLGADLATVTIALGVVQVPVLARVVRSSTLVVREEPYIRAMRALGAGPARIILRHILPNIMSPLVVQGSIIFSTAIVAEASLSFLGLGVQPPASSWGRDLAEARRFMVDAPWLFLAPTGMIVASVVSINFIGDALRDALDPRSWGRSADQQKEAENALAHG
ncbi:ABC transporter permease [Arenibacterium sp. LLYu02]|uniref:ABC transporter permease n=1 Tax=Arenibacterium sp. LLYu02 TaxID=3404132 RepID=UPI003B223E49